MDGDKTVTRIKFSINVINSEGLHAAFGVLLDFTCDTIGIWRGKFEYGDGKSITIIYGAHTYSSDDTYEIMHSDEDEPLGWRTSEEVMKYIVKKNIVEFKKIR
jgi:hypothetical protein